MIRTDDFNRADSPTDLGGNWSIPTGAQGCKILSNKCEGIDPTAWNVEYWSADSWDGDHSSQIVHHSATGYGLYTGPCARVQPDALTLYHIRTYAAAVRLYRTVAGTSTQLGSQTTVPTLVPGDVFKLGAAGSTITLAMNGTTYMTQADSGITGGAPGVRCNTATFILDDWQGEDSVSEGSASFIPAVMRHHSNLFGGGL